MKQVFGVAALALVAILALSWVFQRNDWFMYKVFAPKYEQVRRETFQQTKSYNQGVIQELDRAYRDYNAAASDQEKDAIKSVVLHQVADYDIEKLPSYLREFVQKLRSGPVELK